MQASQEFIDTVEPLMEEEQLRLASMTGADETSSSSSARLRITDGVFYPLLRQVKH